MTQLREAVPVMDTQPAAKRAKAGAAAKDGGAKHRKGLGGVYGASFTGEGTRGLTFERRWTRPGVHPYDEITWEFRTAGISSETGKTVFEQKDVEVPSVLEPARHQRRGQQVLPRPRRHARSASTASGSSSTASSTRITAWAETQHYFATDEDLAAFKAELTHLLVHQKMAFNSPVWFNVGIEDEAAVLRVLHQLGPGQHGLDHGPRQDRGHAVQVRLGRRRQPVDHPAARKAKMTGGGIASGPGQLHEGLRRVRGRHQVGRQDPPRGQDGDPRRRPSGRHRVHRVARPTRSGRPGPSSSRATTRASPARPTAASSSRTPTTACA